MISWAGILSLGLGRRDGVDVSLDTIGSREGL